MNKALLDLKEFLALLDYKGPWAQQGQLVHKVPKVKGAMMVNVALKVKEVRKESKGSQALQVFKVQQEQLEKQDQLGRKVLKAHKAKEEIPARPAQLVLEAMQD